MFSSVIAKPKKWVIRGGLAIFLSIAIASPCLAMGDRPRQKALTSIEGRIINDASSQGISNASVKLYSITSQLLSSVSTSSSGSYFISGEYTGPHIINVSAEGYEETTSSFILKRSKSHYIDIRIKPISSLGPLKIISITPADRSTFVIADTINISVEAQGSGKGQAEYKYLMDGKTLQGWAASSQYTFQSRDTDRGRHTITVEARDKKGNSDAKSVNIYIFRQFPKPNN